MKLLKCTSFLLIFTILFASCRPDGRMLDNNTLPGTPTKADTVLHHQFHVNKGDSIKREEPNVPLRLRR